MNMDVPVPRPDVTVSLSQLDPVANHPKRIWTTPFLPFLDAL